MSLMAHLLPSVCRNTIYNLEMFHIDRCLREGAIQFCKPKLAVAFSFTLHIYIYIYIYVWYGRFFSPMRMKARKRQSAKGAGRTNKLTKLVHEPTNFPSQLLMLEIPSCEPLGVLNILKQMVLVSHISRGRNGENVSFLKVVKINGSFLWEVWVDTLGPRCSHHWGKKN